MKIKNLFFMVMLCVTSVTAYTQTAETFRQPYPAWRKAVTESELHGRSMARSIERTERVECSDGKCNFRAGMSQQLAFA